MVKSAKASQMEILARGPVTVHKLPAPSQSRSLVTSRRRRGKKMRGLNALPVVGPLASQGGQLQEVQAKAMNVKSAMQGTTVISSEGKSAIMTIVNPCGELASDENAKFPDGTLSQSGVQRFRQFETITAPWQTISNLGNTTDNWSLYIISPASFRTIAILIAVRDAKALSDVEFAMVFSSINADSPMANYPDWNAIGVSSQLVPPPPTNPPPNIYYSIYSFRSAQLDLDPATGESRSIESFRIVGDGMVVMHNTPDLWNQGSFAVGQFKTDFALVETDTTSTPVVIEYESFGFTATELDGFVTVYSVINGVKKVWLSGPITGPGPWPFTISSDIAVWSTASPDNEVIIDIASPGPSTIQFVLFTGSVPQLKMVNTGSFATVTVNIFQQKGSFISLFQATGLAVVSDVFNPSQVLLSLPSLNQDAIAQADPKFSAELMKQHAGFYAVRRYFEPKLNMNNSNVSGNIKLEIASMAKDIVIDSPGGIVGDILDRNGSTIVAAIRGISYACSPTIKSVRFVEFLPAPNSPLGPFVGPTPAKDEDAEEIFRQIQLSGPHSYVPDANLLGGLATFIMSVVEAVPVFLRTARGISNAVTQALDWVGSKIPVM